MEDKTLIVFEENLTIEGLEKIKKEAENFPKTITDKDDYKIVYDQHQRFKRLHVAIRKKSDDLILEEKSKFEIEKSKIESDLSIVLGIIEPIRDKLSDTRQAWEDKIAAEKKAAAEIEAQKQREEFERQEKIRMEQEFARKYLEDWDAAIEENRLFDKQKEQEKKDAELQAEIEKLAREKYEFECEKSRLDFDNAWEDAHGLKNDQLSDSGINESADSESVADSDEMMPTAPENIGTSAAEDFLSQEANNFFDTERDRISRILTEARNYNYRLKLDIETGFESLQITKYLYEFSDLLETFILNFPEK